MLGVDRVLPRQGDSSGSAVLPDEKLWSVRKFYLPHGTVGAVRSSPLFASISAALTQPHPRLLSYLKANERYSDLQCLDYLLQYLTAHTQTTCFRLPPTSAAASLLPPPRRGERKSYSPYSAFFFSDDGRSTYSSLSPFSSTSSSSASASASASDLDWETAELALDRLPLLCWDLSETLPKLEDTLTTALAERTAQVCVQVLCHPEPMARAYILQYVLAHSQPTEAMITAIKKETRRVSDAHYSKPFYDLWLVCFVCLIAIFCCVCGEQSLFAALCDVVSGDELECNRTWGWTALSVLLNHVIDLPHTDSLIVAMCRATVLRVRQFAARQPFAAQLTIQVCVCVCPALLLLCCCSAAAVLALPITC
jgi:hypothetical protein